MKISIKEWNALTPGEKLDAIQNAIDTNKTPYKRK